VKAIITEYERVVVTADLPEQGVLAGDIGVVVMIHGDHAGYELEFFTADGHTRTVATLRAEQVRPVSSRDVLHVRALGA
jgi:hypothetical protein